MPNNKDEVFGGQEKDNILQPEKDNAAENLVWKEVDEEPKQTKAQESLEGKSKSAEESTANKTEETKSKIEPTIEFDQEFAELSVKSDTPNKSQFNEKTAHPKAPESDEKDTGEIEPNEQDPEAGSEVSEVKDKNTEKQKKSKSDKPGKTKKNYKLVAFLVFQTIALGFASGVAIKLSIDGQAKNVEKQNAIFGEVSSQISTLEAKIAEANYGGQIQTLNGKVSNILVEIGNVNNRIGDLRSLTLANNDDVKVSRELARQAKEVAIRIEQDMTALKKSLELKIKQFELLRSQVNSNQPTGMPTPPKKIKPEDVTVIDGYEIGSIDLWGKQNVLVLVSGTKVKKLHRGDEFSGWTIKEINRDTKSAVLEKGNKKVTLRERGWNE